jgi:TPR repeat protein
LALAEALEKGLGVERDLRGALQWYEKAAAGGEEAAALRLSEIRGQGR